MMQPSPARRAPPSPSMMHPSSSAGPSSREAGAPFASYSSVVESSREGTIHGQPLSPSKQSFHHHHHHHGSSTSPGRDSDPRGSDNRYPHHQYLQQKYPHHQHLQNPQQQYAYKTSPPRHSHSQHHTSQSAPSPQQQAIHRAKARVSFRSPSRDNHPPQPQLQSHHQHHNQQQYSHQRETEYYENPDATQLQHPTAVSPPPPSSQPPQSALRAPKIVPGRPPVRQHNGTSSAATSSAAWDSAAAAAISPSTWKDTHHAAAAGGTTSSTSEQRFRAPSPASTAAVISPQDNTSVTSSSITNPHRNHHHYNSSLENNNRSHHLRHHSSSSSSNHHHTSTVNNHSSSYNTSSSNFNNSHNENPSRSTMAVLFPTSSPAAVADISIDSFPPGPPMTEHPFTTATMGTTAPFSRMQTHQESPPTREGQQQQFCLLDDEDNDDGSTAVSSPAGEQPAMGGGVHVHNNPTTDATTENQDAIHHNDNNDNTDDQNNNIHLSKNDNWRRHGRAYRASLVQHDEETGRHDFEMSNECSIKRYHLVAEKVLLQFMATRDDPEVNLRDTYLVGIRLSRFLSVVLPTHKDFHAPDPELTELRLQSHARWLALNHYLEELALIIDEEEHNQFVLRDLTNENDAIMGMEDVPPLNIVATSPKKHRRQKSVSPPNTTSDNNSQTNITNTASASSSPVSHQHQHQEDAMSPDPFSPNLFSPNSHTLGIQRHQHRDSDHYHDHHHHQYTEDEEPVSDHAGDEVWKAVDATTVASMDTHWISSGGFSDPFPHVAQSPGKPHKSATRHTVEDQEQQSVPVTSSSPSKNHGVQRQLSQHQRPPTSSSILRRGIQDHEHIEFANISLEEENDGLGYFDATGKIEQLAAAAPAVVSPSPTKGDDTSKLNGSPWKIAPLSSSPKTPADQPAHNSKKKDAYKDKWGCSPFSSVVLQGQDSLPPEGPTGDSADSKHPRVSWEDPETKTPKKNEQDNSKVSPSLSLGGSPCREKWWESPSPARHHTTFHTTSSGSVKGDSPRRPNSLVAATRRDEGSSPYMVKVKPTLRRSSSSQYMVLDEATGKNQQLKKAASVPNSSSSNMKRTNALANSSSNSNSNVPKKQTQAPMAPDEVKKKCYPEELRPIRRHEDSDACDDLEAMSAILDKNKSTKLQPYRHRGIHHLKECVRCLLE